LPSDVLTLPRLLATLVGVLLLTVAIVAVTAHLRPGPERAYLDGIGPQLPKAQVLVVGSSIARSAHFGAMGVTGVSGLYPGADIGHMVVSADRLSEVMPKLETVVVMMVPFNILRDDATLTQTGRAMRPEVMARLPVSLAAVPDGWRDFNLRWLVLRGHLFDRIALRQQNIERRMRARVQKIFGGGGSGWRGNPPCMTPPRYHRAPPEWGMERGFHLVPASRTCLPVVSKVRAEGHLRRIGDMKQNPAHVRLTMDPEARLSGLAQRLAARGVDLVILIPPTTIEYLEAPGVPEAVDDWSAAMGRLMAEHPNVTAINASRAPWDDADAHRYFRDSHHLTLGGAMYFSRDLGAYLRELRPEIKQLPWVGQKKLPGAASWAWMHHVSKT